MTWTKPMNTVEAIIGEAILLEPQGRLDSNSARAFEESVLRVIARPSPRLVIECRNLDYVSSAGLRVFLVAAKKIKGAQGRLALCSLKPHVREVFDVSGFTKLFVIAAGRDDALAAVA